MGKLKRIAIYGGSSQDAPQVYYEAAARLGAAVARRGVGIVYGGGAVGMMGAVADAALEGSIFRMLRQGQRVLFALDDDQRATSLSLGSEVDMGTPDLI